MGRFSVFSVTQNSRRIHCTSSRIGFLFGSTSLTLIVNQPLFPVSISFSIHLFFFLSAPPPQFQWLRSAEIREQWIKRFIIFASLLAKWRVSVHIWSVDNWIVLYLRNLLTFSQRTFDILLRSSRLWSPTFLSLLILLSCWGLSPHKSSSPELTLAPLTLRVCIIRLEFLFLPVQQKAVTMNNKICIYQEYVGSPS